MDDLVRRYPIISRPGARGMRGQALLLFVVFAAVLCMGVVLLFNTGQTVNRKVHLTNTADATAYSVAAQQARALNFAAYMNRGRVANEVTIAQMVSLWSWQNMLHEHTMIGQEIGMVISVIPYVGVVGRIMQRAYSIAERAVAVLRRGTHQVLTLGNIIPGAESAPAVLSLMNSAFASAAEAALYASAADGGIVANRVIQENDPDASMHPAGMVLLGSQLLQASAFADDGLLAYYDRNRNDAAGMDRFHNVVMTSRDRFSADRGDNTRLLGTFRGGFWGGTDLIDYERWAGMDTFSMRVNLPRFIRRLLPRWLRTDIPFGYGGAQAVETISNGLPDFLPGVNDGAGWHADDHPRHYRPYGGSNGNTARLAERIPSVNRDFYLVGRPSPSPTNREDAFLEGYRGLQAYHDIADGKVLSPVYDPAEPERSGPLFTIFLSTDGETLRTSQHIDGIGGPEGGVLQLDDNLRADQMTAVSTAQTYFNRPPANALFRRMVPRQWDGDPQTDQHLEAGNLFSPYWQARLVDTPQSYYTLLGLGGLF